LPGTCCANTTDNKNIKDILLKYNPRTKVLPEGRKKGEHDTWHGTPLVFDISEENSLLESNTVLEDAKIIYIYLCISR
jgi:hypothetical protein